MSNSDIVLPEEEVVIDDNVDLPPLELQPLHLLPPKDPEERDSFWDRRKKNKVDEVDIRDRLARLNRKIPWYKNLNLGFMFKGSIFVVVVLLVYAFSSTTSLKSEPRQTNTSVSSTASEIKYNELAVKYENLSKRFDEFVQNQNTKTETPARPRELGSVDDPVPWFRPQKTAPPSKTKSLAAVKPPPEEPRRNKTQATKRTVVPLIANMSEAEKQLLAEAIKRERGSGR